jgi:hypothetical protein
MTRNPLSDQSESEPLGVQDDGTCPKCGRSVEIECAAHGHLEGDPWAEVKRLSEATREAKALLIEQWRHGGLLSARVEAALTALRVALDDQEGES